MDESLVRRLAFVKYLYSVGINQSKQPEPLCATSILSFHDCVELFLHLISEKLNIQKKDVSFMGYWDVIDPELTKLSNTKLSQKVSMGRLNKARVGLKHSGIIPSKLEIDDFRTITKAFLIENYSLIFEVDFDNISLIDMIKYEQCRESLKKAKGFYEINDAEKGLCEIAISFAYLTKEFEMEFSGNYYASPFTIGRSMAFLNAIHLGIRFEDGKIRNFVDNVSNSISDMQDALYIICLGIDYKKYAKFKMITPRVDFSINGKPLCSLRSGMELNKAVYEYCEAFIIESSLILQEFDFHLECRNNAAHMFI